MNTTKLSQHFHGCIRFAQQPCLGTDLKKRFDFTNMVKDVGWVPPAGYDRFFQRSGGRYHLYDIVLEEWLSVPAKVSFQAGELLDWAFLFARLQGYAKVKLPRRIGRPSNLTASQQEAAIECMAEARRNKTDDVSLRMAALQLMDFYGFKATDEEYERIRQFAYSKKA